VQYETLLVQAKQRMLISTYCRGLVCLLRVGLAEFSGAQGVPRKN